MAGIKYDAGKNRLDLLPVYPVWVLGQIYTFGATKYEDNNWRKGMKWSRIFAAVLRHIFKWWSGEEVDDESGLPHLAHAAWGCFTLLEFSQTHPELDDRAKGSSYNPPANRISGESGDSNGSTPFSKRDSKFEGEEQSVGGPVEGGRKEPGRFDFSTPQVGSIGDSTGFSY